MCGLSFGRADQLGVWELSKWVWVQLCVHG